MADLSRDLMAGAIDMHIHCAPDVVPRLMDDLELAAAARDAGMSAIVLKSHHMLTAARAQLAEKHTPGVRVFGGLALNIPACGGLNPDAVKVALKLGARIIWLPTFSAANHIERTRTKVTGNLGIMSHGFTPRPVAVLDESGHPLPELVEILKLVAEADCVLATGHLAANEAGAVIQVALGLGVRKILVNHAEFWLTPWSVDEQRTFAERGVMFERCIRSVTAEPDEGLSPKLIADAIRVVGAGSTVMATDYGQTVSPPPAEGMRFFIQAMLDEGITADEIDLMVRKNPARLLGIE